ncbi:MAG: DUF1566 domain-containing protein [Nitrosomonas sp.]
MTIYQPRPTLITLKTSIVLLILLGATSPMAGNFPATGQTSCYSFTGILIPCENTGQDGEIQAGKTLKYKDDGKKGTITDLNTLLVWEKKSSDNGIHDKNKTYTWKEAFNIHVATLNNTCEKNETLVCNSDADCAPIGGSCGFAGKRDWRIPNVKELQSIMNYEVPMDLENFNIPIVSAEFNTNCIEGINVLTGSCAMARPYWTSTSCASNMPELLNCAWYGDFLSGNIGSLERSEPLHVRAVRGGLQK